MRDSQTRERGATTVEFALVLPVFLTLVGGLLFFGLHMTYSALAGYAAEAGLNAATQRVSAGGYRTEAQVRSEVTALSPTGLLGAPHSVQVAVTPTGLLGAKRQGDVATVTVTYDVAALRAAAGLIPVPSLADSLRALATIERTEKGRLE